MIRSSRREALMGALAVPALGGLPQFRATGPGVTIYDPTLAPQPSAAALPIEGDPIRFAQRLFAPRPALVVGVSRHADALLIADVGREHGYQAVAAPAALGKFAWALAPRG